MQKIEVWEWIYKILFTVTDITRSALMKVNNFATTHNIINNCLN